jgi:non-heme chloroperoxidase
MTHLTHIGGPTLLIEIEGWRLLTDPTFDPPGQQYAFGWGARSRKLAGPALAAADLGPIDAVLLSHEHHGDNLDTAGRALLPSAGVVVTTVAGERRLGGNARGLAAWATTRLEAPGRPPLTLTATPCRHGPPLSGRLFGEVIGFAIQAGERGRGALWVSGDTVLYDGVRQVADRLRIDTAILHLGGVGFPVAGPVRFTMTARQAVEFCRLSRPRITIPIHYEGWQHFRQGRAAIEREFAGAPPEIRQSARWLALGERTAIGPWGPLSAQASRQEKRAIDGARAAGVGGVRALTTESRKGARTRWQGATSHRAALAAPGRRRSVKHSPGPRTEAAKSRRALMAYVTTRDGTQIYYKDWGAGQPVVFSHGWPLTGDAWESQMVFLVTNGYRCIAHDRRGHGRSSQPSCGNEMDTYADDLATLIEHLDLRDAVLVGHSTGGGEVTRYISRHGTARVAKAVLVSAVPPLMLRTAANPDGLPLDAFDAIRAGTAADRSQFFKDLTVPFFGVNRPGSTVSQGIRDAFWFQGMQAGLQNALECIKAFSETDFTEDLKRFDVPTLIIHGDDDQIVPFIASAPRSAQLVTGAALTVYEGGDHGLADTHKDRLNADLLAFIAG